MSLLIDVLRKFKGDSKRFSIYPALASSKQEGGGRGKILAFGIILLGVTASVGSYFLVQMVLSPYTTPGFRQVSRTMSDTESPPSPPPQEVTAPPTAQEEISPKPNEQGTQVKEKSEGEELPPTQKEIKQAESSQTDEDVALSKLTSDIEPSEAEEKNFVEESKVTEQIPDLDPTTLAVIANDLFKKGNYYKSALYYERSLSAKYDPKVVNNLLIVYTRLKDFSKAEELIDRYRSERLAYIYIMELANSGEPDYALEVSEKLMGYDRSGLVHFARAMILERTRKYKEALEEYSTAYQKNRHDPYLLYNYARMLESVGKLKEAYALYSQLRAYNLNNDMRKLVNSRIELFRRWGFR